MDMIVKLLGQNGIILLIGLCVFFASYKYSIKIFDWVEHQTLGTRTYILEQFELLFIEIKSEHVTYFLLFMAFGNAIIFLGLFGLSGHWVAGSVVAFIACIAGFKFPRPFVDYLVAKRIKLYSGQMVDALTLLSNGIRAGLSVPQALGMVVDEMPAPVSQEFNLILQQNRIGVPLEECFENLAKRVPTEDNDMFVSSINILRETGGNLAEVFDTIVGVIRERIRLQQKIEQLTAASKFQGYVIAAMPFGVGSIFAAQDPSSMIPMFTTAVGLILTFLALSLDLIGLFLILKISKIDV